jgi:hypothetical protein
MLFYPWPLALREERRVRVFENRVLSRLFGPKRDEVIGDWRKLHNELHKVNCSPNIIRMIKSRRMRWGRNVARNGERSNACRVLVGKPKRKRELGRCRCGWGIILKWILDRMGWHGLG